MAATDPCSDSATCVPLHMAIRLRRRALGITQAELTRRADSGITPRQIQRLEKQGSWLPSWVRREQLAAALELPAEAFLYLVDEQSSSGAATFRVSGEYFLNVDCDSIWSLSLERLPG